MWKLNSQCLSIQNIEVLAPIGVFEFEKVQHNTFLVSVDLWGDYQKSMDTDKLMHTLDYQHVFDIVHQVMAEGGDLIESVAQKIMAKILLLDFPLVKVRIVIQKLNPPLKGKVSDTKFELIAER